MLVLFVAEAASFDVFFLVDVATSFTVLILVEVLASFVSQLQMEVAGSCMVFMTTDLLSCFLFFTRGKQLWRSS